MGDPQSKPTAEGPFDEQQDLSGLICPLPILRIKAAVARMQSGQVLKVTVTNAESVTEIHHFIRQTGHRLCAEEEGGGSYRFWIEKRD